MFGPIRRSRAPMRPRITLLAASAVVSAVAATGAVFVPAGPAAAAGGTVSYSATETIPVPPASAYGGSGGGDGWALAVGQTTVYNVFHHSAQLTVACHEQSDATPCWSPETITDGGGGNFATSSQPGLHLDQASGKLYVFATRGADGTAGIVCIDTTQAATHPNPFCGFVQLTPVGAAPVQGGISAVSAPALVGNRWYAFNYVNGSTADAGANQLLCFDVTAGTACPGQPYDASIGSGSVSDGDFPAPAVTAVAGKIIAPVTAGSGDVLACFDPATGVKCAGAWPVQTGIAYDSVAGAPFPLLDVTGHTTGLCLPTGTDQCWSLAGAAVATPPGMAAAIGRTSGWNGAAFVLGPRVYVPDGNLDQVDCYDSATQAGCVNFPKTLTNLELLYTVNPDPQRPTCVWVNSDGGADQIQNFDAYTAGGCGQGPIRVLASSFVVPTPVCAPATYTSLQVSSPARGTYTSGTVGFEDSDGHPITGLTDQPVDGTGSVALGAENLQAQPALPQFLITLNGTAGAPGQVVVTLNWTGTDDTSCANPGTVVTGGGSPHNYVALGDSFSSGEGNPPFIDNTDTKRDQCHRSDAAYPELLNRDPDVTLTSFAFRACSGDVVDQVEFANLKNHEDAQVGHLASATDLVTLSVGGNNVNFSDVLAACINIPHTRQGGSSDCQHSKVDNPDGPGRKVTLDTAETELLNRLSEDLLCFTPRGYVDCHPSLHALYDDIASRIARSGQIIVLLYPHLFTNAPATRGCAVGFGAAISKADMIWINTEADKLDAKIISEVQKAQRDGATITWADPRPDWNDPDGGASPGGHGACTAAPWLNALAGVDAGPVHLGNEVYSFHPNGAGQADFARRVKALID